MFLFVLTGSGFSAENRYALVIGNGAYKDNDITNLANPANDAADIAEVMKDLDYNVTLRTDIGLRDMLSAVRAFSADLKKNPENEGFFWFAGHGLSVKGVHYLLPVDVDPFDDDTIPRTSYSVDDLMEEIEKAGNVTNLIVIDACRNNVIPGSRSVAGRGLAVLSRDDYRVRGNKLVYSTMAGMTAADGLPGSRNSPFAQAFIDNIKTPEPFDDVFLDIANETLSLTRGVQEPYALGAFAVKSYAINPQASREAAAAQQAAVQAAIQAALANMTPKRDYAEFKLDGQKLMNLSVMVSGYPSSIKANGMGAGVSFAFYEKYGKYGDFFYIPNSFFFSADFYRDIRDIKSQVDFLPNDGQERYTGGIFGIGALYKIRLDSNQRFIVNFGPSIEMFLASAQFYYGDDRMLYSSKDGKKNETRFIAAPGLGLQGGLSFRISRLISMDLGFSWKQSLFGSKELGLYADYGLGGIRYLVFNDKVLPYSIGANLGISFWLLR